MKRNLLLIVRFLVSFGLIGYIALQIARQQDLAELLTYFRDADYTYLAGAVSLLLIILGLGSLRWGKLLTALGIRLRPGSVFMYYMIGYFFNNFLPTTVGGDAVKIYYLSRFTRKGAETFISIAMDRIMGMLGLCVVALGALLYGGRRLWLGVGSRHALPIFLVVGGLSLGLVGFFLVVFNQKFMKILLRVAGQGKIGQKLGRILQAVYTYKGQGRVLLQTLFISVVIWVVIIIIVWMVSLTFRVKIPLIPLGYFFLFVPTIGVIMSLPISIAGLGTREASFILFFTSLNSVGIPLLDSDALIISLAFYLVFLLTSVVGGVIYVLKDQLHFHREEILKKAGPRG